MKQCDITGKGKQYGNNVSFSQRHTKKVWEPNLQKKTLVIDGKMNIGPVVAREITLQANKRAKEHGIAFCGMHSTIVK